MRTKREDAHTGATLTRPASTTPTRGAGRRRNAGPPGGGSPRARPWEGGESFESSPGVAGGGADRGAGNGDVVAIAMATGKTRWKDKTGPERGEETPGGGRGGGV